MAHESSVMIICGVLNCFDPIILILMVPRRIGKRNVALVGIFNICKYPKGLKVPLLDKCGIVWISVALSDNIRVMTNICVESTALGVPTNQSALHTYPDDTLILRQHLSGCHPHPEMEIFILGGTFKLKKGKLMPHTFFQFS